MVTLLIVSIVLFVSYIGYTVGMYGIPASISDTYYRFGKKGWLFTLFCLASLVWQVLMSFWYVPLITFLGGVIVLACLKFKKPVFWMEMCAFISTYITLLLLY